MKAEKKYSIQNLIDISFELYKLNNHDDINKDEFEKNFMDDKKNKIYLESRRDRKLRIKLCSYQIQLCKDIDRLVESGKMDISNANVMKSIIAEYSLEKSTESKKTIALLFISKIVMIYLISLASFGLFSYRLNIVNSPLEVFIISFGLTFLLYICKIVESLTYISYERLIPKLVIILGLMIGNIYYPIYEFSYIWVFAFIFIDVVFNLVNGLLNKIIKGAKRNEQSNS